MGSAQSTRVQKAARDVQERHPENQARFHTLESVSQTVMHSHRAGFHPAMCRQTKPRAIRPPRGDPPNTQRSLSHTILKNDVLKLDRHNLRALRGQANLAVTEPQSICPEHILAPALERRQIPLPGGNRIQLGRIGNQLGRNAILF